MPASDQVLTAAQMRAGEEVLVAQGISVDELMQRAGQGAADWVWRVAMGGAVTVLCGPGNNGGDGYMIAETLRARGLEVKVVAPIEPKTDAARNARAAWQGEVVEGADSVHGAVFVDCLFGSGLTRPLSSEHAKLIAQLASNHRHFVAVDLPSGVATDDGTLLGEVVHCDLTLALGAWKPAHFLMPALERLGGVRLVDIGVEPVAGAAHVVPRPVLASPDRAAHKYSRGLLGVVGGAMPGAAMLACKAAMRAGAGYVKLFANEPVVGAPDALVTVSDPLEPALADKRLSALLVGPGLGRSEAARGRLAAVLEARVPAVLDADALHLLDEDLLEGVDTSRLLVTPHTGELAKLCETFRIAEPTKRSMAQGLAEATGLTVLAKGPDNLLVARDGRTAFFPPASSWLANAGTGDVLAGIAASRLSTGRDPFGAAGEAVWLHTEAARIAGPALMADDLAAAVSAAYARFL
ncbi:NAD(P)H-hydrate dehydratase [Tsuneonella mangrovi]|uniref:NAD(P)H-hydrate dehydratase n=1 Tax=Tsuneonella mangrovi TaxID=1982042 RepID=UPI000BA1F756|nr:NAD(P)H-hydrate dehydratase [Tsuneonella mangrovi]